MCIRDRVSGGALILSEKVKFEDTQQQQLLTTMYENFKRSNGYSELEISQKRDALENVLVPLTVSENIEMLHRAGFERVELLLKWFNFATFVCYV